jgi:hypothetical protein
VGRREVHTGGANGGRRGSVAGARAREEPPGQVFVGAGGRLGTSEVTTVTHAHVERSRQGRRRGRSGGQWRAMGGAPASGSTPPGSAHLPRTTRVSSRRRSAVTNGLSGASACAPDAGTTRTEACRRGHARRRGRARLGVPGRLNFANGVFKLIFPWIFKLKCTLRAIAKLKITHLSTTFTKDGRGVTKESSRNIMPTWPKSRRR